MQWLSKQKCFDKDAQEQKHLGDGLMISCCPFTQDSTVICRKRCLLPGECNKNQDHCCKECVSYITPEEMKVCKFGNKIFQVQFQM